MALFKIDITRVTGRGTHLFDGIGTKMLSGYGIYDLAPDGAGSSYRYTLNLDNDREGVVRIETDYDELAIAGYVNAADQSTFISLSVYPEQNTSLPTKTELILIKNISLGYDIEAGAILYVKRGTALQRILVSDTIDEILEITTGDTVLWDDGVDYFRLQVRDLYLNLDQTITATGFAGTEDMDWANIWSIQSTALPDNTFYRPDGTPLMRPGGGVFERPI